MHLPDGVLRTPLRSVTKCTWFQVRFENRLQHQLGRSLYHPVPYGRYPERPLAASGLRDHHPSHRTQRVPRLIRLMAQFLPDAGQPLPQTPRFDFREALSIHPGRSLVGARQFVGMAQNVFPVNLVVEHVEAVSRLVLRLAIQLDLKFPDLARCCQTHRQSPSLPSFTSTPEVRTLSSAGVTRPHRSYGPFRLPDWPTPLLASFGTATPSQSRASPTDPDRLPYMPCSLPRWTGSGARWLSSGALPRPVLPHRFCLPRSLVGSASTSSLSRPAQASHALRPARLLTHHTWALSRGSALAGFPTRTLASYQVLPATT